MLPRISHDYSGELQITRSGVPQLTSIHALEPHRTAVLALPLLLWLWLARDCGVDGQVVAAVLAGGFGAPPVCLHHTGLDQFQARQEPADLAVRARDDREGGLLVIPLHAVGYLAGGDVAGDLRDGQVAARRHGG